MEYEESRQLAQENGFVVRYSTGCHMLYVRNRLKWIHNIERLKRYLGVESDQALREKNYDVDTYYDVITNQRGLLRYIKHKSRDGPMKSKTHDEPIAE